MRMASFCVSLVTLGMAGCALNRTGGEEVAAAWERHQRAAPAEAENYARIPAVRPRRATTAPASTQPGPQMESPTSLREYILLALQSNPEIRRAEEIARAKAARIPQVTALPDPMFNTKTLPTPVRTAEGDNYFILGVSQKLPVPGKLDRAGRIALEETRMAITEWEQTRLRVIADVKRAYFQIYIVDQTIRVDRENQDLLRSLIDVARGQVAAGRRSQEDVLRAQVELSNLEAVLIDQHQRRISAEAMLNAVLNRAPTSPVPPPEAFDVRQIETKLESMFAAGAANNPELARLQRQIERDRHGEALARLAYWPDLTIGFEWMLMEPRDAFRPPPNPETGQRPVVSRMSEEGSDNWAITLGINVPIWVDKIEAGIREARRRVSASLHEFAATRNRIQFQIEDAFTRVKAQQELAELFDSTIIPQARQTYEVSRAGYSAGTSDFQYVIDNWQKWLTFTIQYHRAIGELERSLADLEQAIGLSLADVENTQ
jgi:cobalt-zinc-cadmium efflux system outer membrane protein